MPDYTQFRICSAPPFEVFGGRTHWMVGAEYYGKNGGKLALVAVCVETSQRVVLIDGETRSVLGRCASGFSVDEPSLDYQILRAASRAGHVGMTRVRENVPMGPKPYPARPVWDGRAQKTRPSLGG